jgi:S-(hydroxymethyl)glutathione dehydrogenase / alcohol dehydrogenase
MIKNSISLQVPSHMRGAVLWETGKPLRVVDQIQIPALEDGQVLVKLSYSGVCHSQLMEVRGKRGNDQNLPHLLGHEGSGQVVAIGGGVSKVSPGDSVILGWIKSKGKNVSGAKYQLGERVINSGQVTTFSTYSIVSENRVVPLPPGLPKEIAVLFGCALPTGAGIILNEIKPKKGSIILFMGLGGIGLSALMACSLFECKTVIAIDINEEKLSLAQKFGATHIINSLDVDPLKEVKDITGGLGVDYSVEAAGSVETIEMAFKMLKKNGGKCIFASHPEADKKICLDPFELISGKQIQGTWGGSSNPDNDVPRLAELYLQSRLPLELLLTKTYTLEEINEALYDLEVGNVFRPLIILT